MIHPYEPPLSDAEIEARDPLVLWQQRKPQPQRGVDTVGPDYWSRWEAWADARCDARISRPIACAKQIAVAARMPRSPEECRRRRPDRPLCARRALARASAAMWWRRTKCAGRQPCTV
jgi:hypothetical protein